jgi:hypothetical protein
MRNDVFALDQPHIRGTGSNSLLRMYDAARGIAGTSPSQLERARADRVLRRIARELRRRNIPL